MNTKAVLMLAAFGAMAVAAGTALAAPYGAGSEKTSTDKKDTEAPSTPTGRDALRQIVQGQCVLNWKQHQNPAPCESVFLADSKNSDLGYAILADKKGAAHYLLIPTQTMQGTDGGDLLDPDLPNYFAQAWKARDVLKKFVGHPLPRTAIGLAVNNAHSRTQNQFHIHIDCLSQEVVDTLHAAAEKVTSTWSPITVMGSTYQAMRIESVSLDAANPFELVANLGSDIRHHMGDYTVVVAGMQYQNGAGFMLLTGTGATGELLLDSSCAAAGAGG